MARPKAGNAPAFLVWAAFTSIFTEGDLFREGFMEYNPIDKEPMDEGYR
jgi:hypothetical protein